VEARTPSSPPATVNSNNAAEEVKIAALIFMDIGFYLLER
jgi:hypothetical protein